MYIIYSTFEGLLFDLVVWPGPISCRDWDLLELSRPNASGWPWETRGWVYRSTSRFGSWSKQGTSRFEVPWSKWDQFHSSKDIRTPVAVAASCSVAIWMRLDAGLLLLLLLLCGGIPIHQTECYYQGAYNNSLLSGLINIERRQLQSSLHRAKDISSSVLNRAKRAEFSSGTCSRACGLWFPSSPGMRCNQTQRLIYGADSIVSQDRRMPTREETRLYEREILYQLYQQNCSCSQKFRTLLWISDRAYI